MSNCICIYCHQEINGEYYYDWCDTKVCSSHKPYVMECSCCHHYFVLGNGGLVLQDGRHICEICRRREVNSLNIGTHIDNVYQWLAEKGFNEIQRDHVSIELVSQTEMKKRSPGLEAAGLHAGSADINNEHGLSGFHQNISILSHYNYIQFEATLAHELIHAWQLQQNIQDFARYSTDKASKARAEGFAQLGCYIVYKKRYEIAEHMLTANDTVDATEAKQIMQYCLNFVKMELKNTDINYGVTFDKLWNRKRQVGWAQLIREARTDKLKCYV